MENLGAMAYSRYTGFREITDRDVLELYTILGYCQNFISAQYLVKELMKFDQILQF